jgi:anti-sigma regulatory factor (Ser/Thr protein kinase)
VHHAAAADGLRHAVLFYRGIAEYHAAISRFVRVGLARSEAVLLAVPGAQSLLAADRDLGRPDLLTVTDTEELGRNPARITPELRAFSDQQAGRPVRIVSESAWPDRTAAESCEAARQEALVDRALAGIAGTVLCPYSRELPPGVLADAAWTHQWQLNRDAVVPSSAYRGPEAMPAACTLPLTRPPADAECVEYHQDLRAVRAMTLAAGRRAGLPPDRASDLMLAVSEVAANTLRHTRTGGVVRAWQRDGELLCQIADSGVIGDPLAGLRRPRPDQPGGQGLWLVNQVCDLVELRTGQAGTEVRLRMRLPAGPDQGG